MKNYHKSPLRYPGGKSRAIKFLQDFFPKDFKEFREPFFGGGSVGLYLSQTRENISLFANDLNYDLYCFWQVLKVDSMRLIEKIQAIKESCKDGRVLHAEILSRRKQDLSPLQRAVDFFILNRISFSGLLDCGGYSQKAYESRFTQSSIERLKAMPQILQNFHFSSDDYEVLLQKEGQGVFIFLDPPYFSAIKSKLYG
ncbi:DNA adenine methylase, partial [Campylobacter upsaliensis]